MANVTLDQVNTEYGFFGEMRGSFFGLGVHDALKAFNAAADVFMTLGGDQDKARQFLDSRNGRLLADDMTHHLIQNPKVSDVLKVIKKIPNLIRWTIKYYTKFEKYESVAAAKVVDNLLSEDGGIELKKLGYAPLDHEQKQFFQGAGDLTVALEFDGPDGSMTLIYDMESSRFEIVKGGDALASADMDPAAVATLTKEFLARPTVKNARFLLSKAPGGRTFTKMFDRPVGESKNPAAQGERAGRLERTLRDMTIAELKKFKERHLTAVRSPEV